MSSLNRILLVEDSDTDAELALRALASHNLANEVLRLRNGVEALDYLNRRGDFAGRSTKNPAIVLLDLKMPKMNGMEVLRAIKGDPELATIPVVMMTSSREEHDLGNAYTSGVNAYVVKPIGFQELVAAVEKVGTFWAIVNEPPLGSESRHLGR